MRTAWQFNTAVTIVGGFFSALGVALVVFAITKIDRFNTEMIQLEEWRTTHTLGEAAMSKRLADAERELSSHDFTLNEHSRQLKAQANSIRSNDVRLERIERKVGM